MSVSPEMLDHTKFCLFSNVLFLCFTKFHFSAPFIKLTEGSSLKITFCKLIGSGD